MPLYDMEGSEDDDYYHSSEEDYQYGQCGSEEDSGSSGEDSVSVGEDQGPLFDLGKSLASMSADIGEFTFEGVADLLPSAPGLTIDGYGSVSLPLVDEHQAESLVKLCEQAPYGHGHHTVIDTSVRNSWQLEPERVKMENPDWDKGIQGMTKLIAGKLGLSGIPITLELYKFLLYKQGGHFAKHRDTEKADRIFATAVIQLPSAHKGGQLVIYNDDKFIVHDFGQEDNTSQFKSHYAVHYADAEHSLKIVTKGYRLALVYSICWPADNPLPAPTLENAPKTQMLTLLKSLANAQRQFHYFLSHDYTPKSITEMGIGALKGTDRQRFANLRQLNDWAPPEDRYAFYLAKAERTTSWYGSGGPFYGGADEWELSDVTSSVVDLYRADGQRFMISDGRFPSLFNKDTLNPDRCDENQLWRGHRTTDYEGYLGNEGPTKDTTYHKYILLAFPLKTVNINLVEYVGEEAAFSALLDSKADSTQITAFLQHVVDKRKTQRDRFRPLFGSIYGHNSAKTSSASFRRSVFKAISSQEIDIQSQRKLFSLYLNLFGTGGGLFAEKSALKDMTQIIGRTQLWDGVKSQAVNLLKDDLVNACALVTACATSVPDVESWRCVLDLLLKRNEPPYLNDLTSQSSYWRAALTVKESKLLNRVVGQYSDLRGAEECDNVIAAILAVRQSSPRVFSPEKKEALRPLLERRMRWNEARQKELNKTPTDTWRFKEATFPPRPQVNGFLHGPERKYDLGGLAGIGHARNFVNKYQREAREASVTLSPGGRGSTAFVTFTKTTSYHTQRRNKSKALAEELESLRKIVGDPKRGNLGEISPNAADGVGNARPAKKVKRR